MPQTSEHDMKSTMPIWMRRRGSYLSASAPAKTPKISVGSQWAMMAKPARAGEWNFWKIIQ